MWVNGMGLLDDALIPGPGKAKSRPFAGGPSNAMVGSSWGVGSG